MSEISVEKNSFQLKSFCKINWNLQILGKRDDGFHELCTIFQTVSLHDKINFEKNENLLLTCNSKNIPIDESNLIIKAAKLLQNNFNISKGAKIYLEKNIPSPGGLGGGSSNAAVALLGLAKLWNLKIEFKVLLDFAKQIGSDVPFFLYGGTALGLGSGTEIFPFEEIKEKFILIVTPDEIIPTGEAFARVNVDNLTNSESKRILQIRRNEAQLFDSRQSILKNDFESSVFSFAPEIKRVKATLLQLGALTALLSGSGASVFGLFDTEETRQTAQKALENEFNWRSFAVATISRDEYREALKECSSLLPISF
ncbi:MAG: 4-(cytidine 5'-diphospho)-2-C-methyl-D-erythritol kinase [Pyrinomonadaceae bacterium]